jgi:hypothetical protein
MYNILYGRLSELGWGYDSAPDLIASVIRLSENFTCLAEVGVEAEGEAGMEAASQLADVLWPRG